MPYTDKQYHEDLKQYDVLTREEIENSWKDKNMERGNMSDGKMAEDKPNAGIGEITGDEFVSGFSLTGEYVKNLTDKSFTITGQRTELTPDLDHPEERKKKLILTVKMADGTVLDYYPNKTSQKFVVGKRGYKLESWLGFEGKFITENQLVGPKRRDVIYIEGSV